MVRKAVRLTCFKLSLHSNVVQMLGDPSTLEPRTTSCCSQSHAISSAYRLFLFILSNVFQYCHPACLCWVPELMVPPSWEICTVYTLYGLLAEFVDDWRSHRNVQGGNTVKGNSSATRAHSSSGNSFAENSLDNQLARALSARVKTCGSTAMTTQIALQAKEESERALK